MDVNARQFRVNPRDRYQGIRGVDSDDDGGVPLLMDRKNKGSFSGSGRAVWPLFALFDAGVSAFARPFF